MDRLALEVDSNWSPTWANNFVSQPGRQAQSYIPIPAAVCPVLIESPILAVTTKTSDPFAKPRWWLGAWINQVVRVNTLNGELLQAARKPARLNTTTLLRFEPLTSQYQLKIEIPYWLSQLELYIYEYTGPIDGVDENLEALRVDVARIEFKLDSLR